MSRPRRQRSLRENLASIVLGFEAIVMFLGSLAIFGLQALPAPLALWGGGLLCVIILLAAALVRYQVGIILGWVVQFLVLSTGIFVSAMFVVGALFAAMWTYAMFAANRAEKQKG